MGGTVGDSCLGSRLYVYHFYSSFVQDKSRSKRGESDQAQSSQK